MPTSIVPQFPQPIDNRALSMDVRFYMLNESDTKKLANMFLRYVKDILTPNIVVRSQYDRKKRFHLHLEKDILAAKDGIEYSFEADFVSSAVHNISTFRQFDNYLLYEWHPRRGMSDEYMAYFNKRLRTQRMDNKAIQKGLIDLFSHSSEIPFSSYGKHDVIGSFQSIPYWFHPGMYHGQFHLSIAKECLGPDLAKTADSMSEFMENMAAEMRNIGGTVRLAPYSYMMTPYMYYFGNQYIMDDSHQSARCYPNEWYPFYYHDGIEWFNLLTCYSADKIDSSISKQDTIKCRRFAHGGLSVKMNQSIGEPVMSDYVGIKNFLYASLIPGMSRIPLKSLLDINELGYLAKPRKDWEIIPISPAEIYVEEDCVVFKHRI